LPAGRVSVSDGIDVFTKCFYYFVNKIAVSYRVVFYGEATGGETSRAIAEFSLVAPVSRRNIGLVRFEIRPRFPGQHGGNEIEFPSLSRVGRTHQPRGPIDKSGRRHGQTFAQREHGRECWLANSALKHTDESPIDAAF
jgi:hypothetical protein